MADRLQGRLALVTGSGTGIGREVALEFARQGADVVLHYSNSKEGAEIMATFKELNNNGTTIIQVTHSEKNASYGRRIIHLLDGWIQK